MSAIRYFEDVPHVVRYGMQDDKEEKSWVLFWRNGVGFRIHTVHEDVRDTPFSKPWLEYLKEPNSTIDGYKGWVQRWEALCDCIISQCLPLLKELAPSSRQWVTLDDYLHTPTYELKMVTDPATKDASPEITEGPTDKPAYENWPTAAANIKYLPEDARRYQAKDLVVLDQSKNWRCPPYKVQTGDGQIFFFMACEKTAKHMPEEKMINGSIDTINVYSRLVKSAPSQVHIPRLAGIVVTEPGPDITDTSPSVDWKDEPEGKYHDQQHHDKELVAGILLTYITHSQSLYEVLKADGDKPTSDQTDKWKKQITEAADYLHGLHITDGGREGKAGDGSDSWYYINQHVVRVAGRGKDTEGDAWLTLGAGCTYHELEGPEDVEAQKRFDEEQAMDLKGITKTFAY